MIKLNGKEVKFETFPNGESRFDHKELFVTGKNEKILFKYENDGDLIKLMLLKNYLDDMLINNVTLFITYMPYSRMDRSEENSPFTLKYISNFIKGLNFMYTVVAEPHSDVTPALLDKVVSKYINFNLVEQVKELVGFNEDEDYIVFPDAGAGKRYSKMKAKNVLVGHKHRDFQTGEIKSLDLVGDFNTACKKAIIVDDLSSYGGTFVKTAEALRKEGCEEIYLLVAHAENSIFKGKLFDNITKVFTTDSILTEHNYPYNRKFENQLHIFNIEGVL
jgi:ribose-phosphate pyrophosphokinase